MTNLEWIRTLSAKELSDLLYDYWLPRGQYVWTDSRKGLVKMLCETYLERDCDKCKHQGNCYCVKGLGCPFDPKTKPSNSEKPNICEVKNYCDDCLYTDTCDSKEFFYACTSKATISKMEQVEDEPKTQTETQNSNLTFEKAYEPQTEDFKACVEGLTLLWIYNYVTDDEFHRIDARLKCKGEPQTENLFTDKYGDVWEWRGDAWYCISGDEPQTEEGASCRQARAKKFGEMDDATFKSHCLNCQRDTADIKCLDCDGNKYFLPYGSKTDCAWK